MAKSAAMYASKMENFVYIHNSTSLSAFVRYVYHEFSCFNINGSLSKLCCGVVVVAAVAVFNFAACVQHVHLFRKFYFFCSSILCLSKRKNFHRLIYRSSFLSVVSHFLSMLSCWCSSIPFIQPLAFDLSLSHSHIHARPRVSIMLNC